jgi:hypothetical protein
MVTAMNQVNVQSEPFLTLVQWSAQTAILHALLVVLMLLMIASHALLIM